MGLMIGRLSTADPDEPAHTGDCGEAPPGRTVCQASIADGKYTAPGSQSASACHRPANA